MHTPTTSQNSNAPTRRACAIACLHTLLSSFHSSRHDISTIQSNRNSMQYYQYLRFVYTMALWLVANLPVVMLVALCMQLPFQGMQADFMIFFILTCELLMLCTAWKLTGMLTKSLAHAHKQNSVITHNLEETQKLAAIGRLASSVNHEINNPLAIINEKSGLATDILEFSDDFPERERFAKLITSITNAVERCQGISQRMLHFSRRKEAVIESININDLLAETVTFLDREIRTRGVNVVCQCHQALPCIMSERGPLQQVFLNLLNNGLAALPALCPLSEQSTLDLNAHPNTHLNEIGFTTNLVDNMVIVSIHDTGTGMTEDVQSRLFEPFFSTKGNKGTGLGMYISQSIINRLGGTISMKSVLGHGTTFTISLPITPIKTTPLSGDAVE
ncbi:MAG: ATP-binding protein [Pseudomonadota bacterium]